MSEQMTNEQLDERVKWFRALLKSDLVEWRLKEFDEVSELAREGLELRRDKDRLDWLLSFITQNGASRIELIDWTVLKDADGDFSDRSELVLDRTAIDAAMKKDIN